MPSLPISYTLRSHGHLLGGRGDEAQQCRGWFFTILYLHCNQFLRAWPTQDTLAKEVGVCKSVIGDATKWWKNNHGLLLVPPDKRIQGEPRGNRHVYQITGILQVGENEFTPTIHFGRKPEVLKAHLTLLKTLESPDYALLASILTSIKWDMERGSSTIRVSSTKSNIQPGVSSTKPNIQPGVSSIKSTQSSTSIKSSTSIGVSVNKKSMTAMKNAITHSFNWTNPNMTADEINLVWKTKLTSAEKKFVQQTASELCQLGDTPDMVKTYYNYCDERFNFFTPRALLNHRQAALKENPPAAEVCPDTAELMAAIDANRTSPPALPEAEVKHEPA